MTFETARMRTGSETLLSSKLQLTQAMRALSAVVGDARSATVGGPKVVFYLGRYALTTYEGVRVGASNAMGRQGRCEKIGVTF